MGKLVEVVLPPRLGADYRWLLASSWTTNLGDGVAVAAGPLLVASLTSDAFLVSLAALLRWAPPLVFGLSAGVLSDRLNRRRIVIAADGIRAVVLSVLVVTMVTGQVTVTVALVALGLLATAEVFADNTSTTLAPMLVHRDDLPVANSRLQAGAITLNQLAGPPIGAALFAAGRAWPFVAQSVLVLYADQRLGLGAVGFGLLTTISAAGGLLGTALYGWITRRVSLGNVMRVGLIIETLTHLALAITTSAWVASLIFFVFGAHAFIWGTTSLTVRQRAVPTHLQGRVSSVNTISVFGGLVVGSAVGGTLATHAGVTAPFWFAFAGSAAFVVLLWRELTRIAHTNEQP